jgi:hypothetical protein
MDEKVSAISVALKKKGAEVVDLLSKRALKTRRRDTTRRYSGSKNRKRDKCARPA